MINSSKTEQEPPQSIDDLVKEFQLFPYILDIISRLKDDELDVSRAVNALNEKIAKSFKVLATIPGANRTLEEQDQLLQSYKDKLEKKKELIAKLTEVEMFKRYIIDEQQEQKEQQSKDLENQDQQQEQKQEAGEEQVQSKSSTPIINTDISTDIDMAE